MAMHTLAICARPCDQQVKMVDPAAPPARLLHEAIQPPTDTAVNAAVTQLLRAGALCGKTASATVTPLGRLLASLPVSVPLGRLVVVGEALGLGRPASVIAAVALK